MSILVQAFIFLCAAVITVPLAKRIGLGSVLGYLLAGVIIGPYLLGFVGDNVSDVMHFAEFGVVMMLFLVGLELEPALLWRMRTSILGLGGAQVLVTCALITAITWFFGVGWHTALALGMILALSSTAIVLQVMTEKGLMKTEVGHSAFSILLFQDIAVIPVLVILPLLVVGGDIGAAGDDGSGINWIAGLTTVLVVAGIVLAGRFLVRPLFRIIAGSGVKEIFTATALVLVIGIALLMEVVGLSAALGTFLAGVVLADSEYKHELEVEIEPFKGLLLGLFFISVGASIDFAVLFAQPVIILVLVVALILVKMLVLFGLGALFRLRRETSLHLGFALAQGGEFCFVLFSFADQQSIISKDIISPMVVVVALSMVLTPVLLMVYQYLIEPRLLKNTGDAPGHDQIVSHESPVILAGMGRFGQIVSRLLGVQGFHVTVLEHDPAQIELVRKFGNKAFYGDASRVDLLRSAGADEAKLLVVAVDSHAKALEITEHTKKHFPHLRVLARAQGRWQAHELERAGADIVVRETFHSALNLGERALQMLGMRAFAAHRAQKAFYRYDEQSMRELAELWGDEKGYIRQAQKSAAMLSELLQHDAHDRESIAHDDWDEQGNTDSEKR